MLFNETHSRLRKAIEQGDHSKIKSLLDKVDPNEAGSDGRTALSLAAGHGQLSTVKLLLDHGAHANGASAGG